MKSDLLYLLSKLVLSDDFDLDRELDRFRGIRLDALGGVLKFRIGVPPDVTSNEDDLGIDDVILFILNVRRKTVSWFGSLNRGSVDGGSVGR